MNSVLFLHMGPGFSSHVERQRLGATFPVIDFWDQPRPTGPKAYSELVEAAIKKLQTLARSGPVDLIGHSFGGQLAMELARRFPKQVRRYMLISTAYHPAAAFYRLVQRHPNNPVKFEDFSRVVDEILKLPDFLQLYWHSPKLYQEYLKDLATGPAFDFAHFMDTMRERIAVGDAASSYTSCLPPENIYLGRSDPLIDPESEAALWQNAFPSSKIEIVEAAGHNLHLESPQFETRLRYFLDSTTKL